MTISKDLRLGMLVAAKFVFTLLIVGYAMNLGGTYFQAADTLPLRVHIADLSHAQYWRLLEGGGNSTAANGTDVGQQRYGGFELYYSAGYFTTTARGTANWRQNSTLGFGSVRSGRPGAASGERAHSALYTVLTHTPHSKPPATAVQRLRSPAARAQLVHFGADKFWATAPAVEFWLYAVAGCGLGSLFVACVFLMRRVGAADGGFCVRMNVAGVSVFFALLDAPLLLLPTAVHAFLLTRFLASETAVLADVCAVAAAAAVGSLAEPLVTYAVQWPGVLTQYMPLLLVLGYYAVLAAWMWPAAKSLYRACRREAARWVCTNTGAGSLHGAEKCRSKKDFSGWEISDDEYGQEVV